MNSPRGPGGIPLSPRSPPLSPRNPPHSPRLKSPDCEHANTVDDVYNLTGAVYRIVSSDGVLFSVSQHVLAQSEVLWDMAQAASGSEIVLMDDKIERAAPVRTVLDVMKGHGLNLLELRLCLEAQDHEEREKEQQADKQKPARRHHSRASSLGHGLFIINEGMTEALCDAALFAQKYDITDVVELLVGYLDAALMDHKCAAPMAVLNLAVRLQDDNLASQAAAQLMNVDEYQQHARKYINGLPPKYVYALGAIKGAFPAGRRKFKDRDLRKVKDMFKETLRAYRQ